MKIFLLYIIFIVKYQKSLSYFGGFEKKYDVNECVVLGNGLLNCENSTAFFSGLNLQSLENQNTNILNRSFVQVFGCRIFIQGRKPAWEISESSLVLKNLSVIPFGNQGLSSLVQASGFGSEISIFESLIESFVLCGCSALFGGSNFAGVTLGENTLRNITLKQEFQQNAENSSLQTVILSCIFCEIENVYYNGIVDGMYSNIFNCLNTTFKTIATKRDPNNSNERYSYRITVSSNKSFSNCEWVSCTSSYSGGALFISSSYSYAVGNVQVNKCSFSECTSHQNGGAIASGTSSYSYYYYPLSISDSSFKNCSGSFGGALYNIATMYVLTSEGSSCSASSMGGFAFISKGLSIVVQFANCQINKCSANTGGGIVVVNCGPLLNISSCTFSQCESKIGGGAIVVSMYSLSTEIFEMTSCSFRENKVKNKTYHFGNDIYIVNYEKSVPSDFLSTSTSTSETPRLYIDGYGPCDEYWKKLVEKKKFPVVAIVLIIVGVVIFVVVIVIIICCCCRKKKKSDSSASNVATTGIVVDTIVEQQQYVPTQAINPSCQGYGVQQQQMQFSGMQPGLMNGYSSYGPAPSQMQPSGQYPVSVAPMMNSPQGSIQQAQPMQPMQPVQPMQQMQPMQPIQPAQQQVAFTIPQQCMTNQPPMEQTQAYELTDVNEKANDFVVA